MGLLDPITHGKSAGIGFLDTKAKDPAGIFKPSPKKPKKTAQDLALERQQRTLLDKEIEEQEQRFKLLARGKLGRQSLLSGAPRTATEAAGGSGAGGGRGGAGSLLPGAGTPSGGIPSGAVKGVNFGSMR